MALARGPALLVKRLELPDENPWFVGKMAEAVVSFYAALEENPDEPQHPTVRGAVRRMERLKEMDRITPGRGSASEVAGSTEDLEAPQSAPETPPGSRPPAGALEPTEGRTARPWYRRWLGG